MELESETKEFLDRFPFLSLCKQGNEEYIGIVQNIGNTVASVYVFNKLKEKEKKKLFLELGEEWWWESNRMIPINIILGKRFQDFRYILTSFSIKNFEILYGPSISLQDVIQKRVKRRQIQLIRKEN
jgi:hypothetical protein|tara:strand:+ start:136 stop:516 length:381 start_codon:yes stop_codon:yes gene_type:complete